MGGVAAPCTFHEVIVQRFTTVAIGAVLPMAAAILPRAACQTAVMSRVTFLGLGVMGGPMAGHLAAAGHDVTVYNRTASTALAWVARHGHRAAPTPAEAADGAEVVLVCVGNDDDVRDVVLGVDRTDGADGALGATSAPREHGALGAMAAGSVLVDHTTASARLARELATACAAAGVGFVDAPVSGGQAGAEQGSLTVMCGSDDEDVFDRARDVIGAYAKACQRMGPAGAGQLTKMVNQICIAGTVQGLAEAVNFAQLAGLDVHQVVDVIGKGAAQSWQLDNRARTMAKGEFEFGFAVEWMRKDLAIVLDEAARNGARLPVTALVDQFYAHVVERGGRRWDTSSLVDLLQRP
jgi:3-hydroxyisobutyrate dehydrogenase-like beta-hydroxyacid dehydrogenase